MATWLMITLAVLAVLGYGVMTRFRPVIVVALVGCGASAAIGAGAWLLLR